MAIGLSPRRLGSLLAAGLLSASLLAPVADAAAPAATAAPASVGMRADRAVALAAGWGHTCALIADGTVKCWGHNGHGRLGDGTTTERHAPVTVIAAAGSSRPLSGVIAISAGYHHTCALLADGTVRCWGNNDHGELGDGTVGIKRPTPVPVVAAAGSSRPLSGVIAISASGSHTCALLVGGTVKCWGTNVGYGLGDGTTSRRLAPVTVIAGAGNTSPLTSTVALAGGERHICALLVDGTVRCWGANYLGQLGDGTATRERRAPVTVVAAPGSDEPLARVTQISASADRTCALIANGTVRCWGYKASQSASPLARVTGIAVGGFGTCALIASGTVRCWGSEAPEGAIPLGRVVAIAAGLYHACTLLADGTVRCWGWNAEGQLGDGTTTRHLAPVTVIAAEGSHEPLTNVGRRSIAAGDDHTCALLADGTVRCWGDGTSGQLGDDGGAGPGSSVPVTVVAAPGSTSPLGGVTAIAAGDSHTCALLAGGTVACWGANAAGQLGDGTTTERPAPVQVVLDDADRVLARVTAIAAGEAHSCAKLAAGIVRCWGANASGQLGDGTTTGRLTPVRVVEAPGSTNNLAGVVAIATGDGGTCAGLVRGAVTCWGANASGQLGDGTTTGRLTAVTVVATTGGPAELRGVGGLAAGAAHGCAVLADGTVRCWGDDDAGALGDGTSGTDRLVPVAVLGPTGGDPLAGVNGVAAGAAHSCAVRSDGAVMCWGANASGQLGDGTTTDNPRPVRVLLP